MRIMLFALTYWNDEAHSHRFDGKWCSYENWLARVDKFFKPFHIFLACGTWSDPRFNRLRDVPTVNSGAPCDAPYDWDRHQYACCALSAAMAYALNRNDWDYLVTLDTDALVGDVNLPALFEDFSHQEATMMAPAWSKGISGPFVAWKRRGAATFAHHRLYPNLCDPDEPARPVIPEDEMALMYKNGRLGSPHRTQRMPHQTTLAFHYPPVRLHCGRF